jgi:TatD DNase family protein
LITDTHAHLFWQSFDADRDAVLERAHAAGIERMIIVGTDVASSQAAFELCAARPGLFPTAGIHPHDATAFDAQSFAHIEAMCARGECVAVGETGLDYFKELSPRAVQRANFEAHIELARKLDKPLVVHCRGAHADTHALLAAAPGVRGVMHCYTMGTAELPDYLDLGFYISFSGVVTYTKNEENRAAARAVPLERILFETDCPYLAPQAKRGRRNEPAFLRETIECVARARGIGFEELAEQASVNAARLFALPSTR